jgi:hypothetical protein
LELRLDSALFHIKHNDLMKVIEKVFVGFKNGPHVIEAKHLERIRCLCCDRDGRTGAVGVPNCQAKSRVLLRLIACCRQGRDNGYAHTNAVFAGFRGGLRRQ